MSGALILFGGAWKFFSPQEKDRLIYHQLFEAEETREKIVSHSHHEREGVRKEIWYQEATPLYLYIESRRSQLDLSRSGRQCTVIEKFNTVYCIVQEELYYLSENGEESKKKTPGSQPRQRLRYLEAQRASYNYNSQHFIAEEVQLWKYELAGHVAPALAQLRTRVPLMRATAESVEFSLAGKQLDFVAHQMRAVVNSTESKL